MPKQRFSSEVVIGLEIHAELSLNTKLFCGCSSHGTEEPNTRTCAVCLGMPGSKPVLNRRALEFALRLCLALMCKISPCLVFSRKSYFYPDMAKNYQITQYELPLGENGKLALESGREIGITRVHIEEDPAALVHPEGMSESRFVLVDYNRSGDALVEIVTEPMIESADEARDFMRQLISVLNYLGIYDVKRCVLKADVNVSIRETEYRRVEIKNITGFREIERAIMFEVERQRQHANEIVGETRVWDAKKGMTVSVRMKEAEEEYGYIIDPDLVKIEVTKELIDRVKKTMPELARSKRERFVRDYRISLEDAKVLAAEKELAGLFERVASRVDPSLAAKWLRRELMRVMNYANKGFNELRIDERHIIELLQLVEKKEITDAVAKKILEGLVEKPFSPREYVKKKRLSVVSDSGQIMKWCEEAIGESQRAVEDYKRGNEKALHFVVGKVMAKSKGSARAEEVLKILKEIMDKSV